MLVLPLIAGVVVASSNSGSTSASRATEDPKVLYRTCTAALFNYAGYDLKLRSAEKYSKDSWVPYRQPGDLPAGSLYRTVATESGFLRGCWHKMSFADGNGTVEVYVANPFTGSNRYHCIGTGQYYCMQQPYRPGYNSPQRLTGAELLVNYAICREFERQRCSGMDPAPRYP
jgi:hypothetical protein